MLIIYGSGARMVHTGDIDHARMRQILDKNIIAMAQTQCYKYYFHSPINETALSSILSPQVETILALSIVISYFKKRH